MNPSFEEYWNCPTQTANVSDCKWVFDPQCIDEPLDCKSSSDYFNVCSPSGSNVAVPYAFSGFQNAKSGEGFMGGITHDSTGYREYIQIKLTSALHAGTRYIFSFHLNLANYSHVATDAIGLKFVDDSIYYSNQYLWEFMEADWVNESGNYITDTINWTKLTGEFTALGGEQWMIIGVFHPEEIVPSIIVNPNTNSAWHHISYYYYDDFELIYAPPYFPNIFTPNGDNINDVWFTGGNVKTISILNRWGNVVFEAEDSFQGWDGKNRNGEPCEDGVYFYILYEQNPFEESKKRHNGYITLLR